MRIEFRRWLERFAAIEVGLACLAGLLVLVAACTLAQVKLGTFGAVEVYIRSWLLWTTVGGLRIPVFPGGAAFGLIFAVNLAAAIVVRHTWYGGRRGLLLAHFGIILLVGGEFLTAAFSVESNLSFEEGSTKAWTESYRRFELALIDATDPKIDRVHAIPASRLARGGTVADARLPFQVRILEWHANAHVMKQDAGDTHGHALATRGTGKGMVAHGLPLVSADDQSNAPAALVELLAGSQSLGSWLLSSEGTPQAFEVGGRKYELALRLERYALPFSLTLKDFTHDQYPGTDIPKNFSSLVRLVDGPRHQDRDVLIWMNHPLRYRGLTFYQASFGKNDTLSVLQVVRNPGWTLPYLACLLVAVGMAWHYLGMLAGRRPEDA